MTNLFDQGEIAEVMGNVEADKLTLEQAVSLFETVYMTSRNLSPRTRVEYRNDVVQLTSFLKAGGVTKPTEVDLAHLQGFMAQLDARGLSGVARRRKASSIRALFRFLAANDLVSHNPTMQLIPPEREYREPRYLTKQEYQALLRACSHETRDAAIIELILQTGIRLSEVALLSIHDVELPARINRDPANTGSIFVHGKGRKERSLPLNYKACRALKAWLSIRPDIDNPALFVTRLREPMGPRAIENTVSKYLKEADIRGASCHSLRHTFGTHHAAKGTDLRSIQEALGHADLKTTSIYISLAKEGMKRELQDHAL